MIRRAAALLALPLCLVLMGAEECATKPGGSGSGRVVNQCEAARDKADRAYQDYLHHQGSDYESSWRRIYLRADKAAIKACG